MRSLEFRMATVGSSAEATGLSRAWLRRARATGVVVVGGYTMRGDVLGLGRYHLRPRPEAGCGVATHRRRGGGRLVPLGEGFVVLVLALPHRSALVADDPGMLAPEQVLNRAVRGLLGALDRLGIPASYPGRDVVTVHRRIIAGLTFDVDPDGATLVEMAVALEQNYAVVTELADRRDPTGVIPVGFLGPDDGTSVAAITGRGIEPSQLVSLTAECTAERFGLQMEEAPPLRFEGADDAGQPADVRDSIDPSMHRARGRSMLGTLEAYVSMADDLIAGVRLCGDLIAPWHVIGELERSLVGLPADDGRIREVLIRRLGEIDGYVLGTSLEAIAGIVVEAAAE